MPNAKGAERAIAAQADEVELVVSASETHNQKNVRRSVAESLIGARDVVELAHAAGIEAEAIVSTAFGCPYEGDVAPERVAQLAGHLIDAGADRLSFGDTTGHGHAAPRRTICSTRSSAPASRADRVGLHFHDTRGTALANVLAALERGVVRFDASIGGLGGCPYAPGASGNAVTEDLVHMCRRHGDRDRHRSRRADRVRASSRSEIVGRELPSALLHAGPRTRRTA